MSAPDPDIKHCWLVGLTGVGKTSIGKRVAARLDMPFFDTDAEVSRQCHMSIAEFWEEHGEQEFRRLEQQAVLTAQARDTATVIATGGGAILSEGSRMAMRASGLVAWIEMDLDYLAERLASRRRRPVLDGDLRTRLAELMSVRRSLYSQVSDWSVDASYRAKDDVADALAAWFEEQAATQKALEPPP